MLEVRNLSAWYGNIQALNGISFRVEAGSCVALLGANGAGKTTTLKSISGVVKHRADAISFDGQPILGKRSDQIVSAGVAHVPEGREIFADMSVRENLELGSYLRRDTAGIEADRERVVGYFPVLQQRFRQRAGTLSGGEQQMLLIARALMARPRLLALDEPSLGLSPILVDQIFAIIRQLRADGLTILLVEQSAQLALETADHAYVLDNGEIAFEGPSRELITDERVRAAYLGL